MLSCKNEPNVKDHKDGYDPYLCGLQGKVPLISQPGVHPLHIFLLVLAVFHVLYSVGTMALGQAKEYVPWLRKATSKINLAISNSFLFVFGAILTNLLVEIDRWRSGKDGRWRLLHLNIIVLMVVIGILACVFGVV